jgi:hypothetical protein
MRPTLQRFETPASAARGKCLDWIHLHKVGPLIPSTCRSVAVRTSPVSGMAKGLQLSVFHVIRRLRFDGILIVSRPEPMRTILNTSAHCQIGAYVLLTEKQCRTVEVELPGVLRGPKDLHRTIVPLYIVLGRATGCGLWDPTLIDAFS